MEPNLTFKETNHVSDKEFDKQTNSRPRPMWDVQPVNGKKNITECWD
jgi:hypothetical protein